MYYVILSLIVLLNLSTIIIAFGDSLLSKILNSILFFTSKSLNYLLINSFPASVDIFIGNIKFFLSLSIIYKIFSIISVICFPLLFFIGYTYAYLVLIEIKHNNPINPLLA